MESVTSSSSISLNSGTGSTTNSTTGSGMPPPAQSQSSNSSNNATVAAVAAASNNNNNNDLEELITCGYCKQKFNDTDHVPKLLPCKHYFCLHCLQTNLNKNHELYCIYCWKRTEIGDIGLNAFPIYGPIMQLVKNYNFLACTSSTSTTSACGLKAMKLKLDGGGKKVINSENCHTHAMPLALYCHTCYAPLCRACANNSEHQNHQIKSQNEAKDQLIGEMQIDLAGMNKMLAEIQRLAHQQREFLIKILEACITLKTHVEADLSNNHINFEIIETRDILNKLRLTVSMADNLGEVQNVYNNIGLEKQRLHLKYQEMHMQCQLDDLIKNSNMVLDFQLLKQAISNLQEANGASIPNPVKTQQNPILFLANYCMSQLYSRHVLKDFGNSFGQSNNNNLNPNLNQNFNFNNSFNYYQLYPQQMNSPQGANNQLMPLVPPQQHLSLPQTNQPKNIYQENNILQTIIQQQLSPQIARNPAKMCPLYYFNIDVNGTHLGRIVIEVRSDVAPKMAKNFGLLCTGETGIGYKGCQIFQCWEGESVITGDFELNNGRGGRSIFEDHYFLPDDTKLMAVRGTVGMRRTQKRHDNLGMVGSQFRIILQEMRGFTGIFGHVVEGLELVEKISTYGDTAGKPTKTILISKCGKL